jgi:predicted solute-binding protein
MRGEIEEAERREQDWDRFYEAKRKEMEEFQAESRRFEAQTREEVQRLRDSVSQVWSRYFASINYDLLSSSECS